LNTSRAVSYLLQLEKQTKARKVEFLSAEQYIDEYDRFKDLFEAVCRETKRKKDQPKLPIAFLHLTSAYGEIEMDEMVGKWKGMIRMLETGFDKKTLPEGERELIAAMLLLSAEIRSKQTA
jgi:hypothetical protein